MKLMIKVMGIKKILNLIFNFREIDQSFGKLPKFVLKKFLPFKVIVFVKLIIFCKVK